MNLKNIFASSIMLATMVIPLDKKEAWTELAFKNIPTNTVTYSTAGLKVTVKDSASPLVYKLDKFYKVSGFEVNLKIDGDLKNDPPEKKIEEDSLFRLGLVVEGKQKLSAIKKLFAPDWVKKLFALAPEGAGLEKIYFYNVGRTPDSLGIKRDHPKTDLMSEEIVAVHKKSESEVKIIYQLPNPVNIAALWLSIDGDDSKSSFTTQVEKITLITAE